MSNRRMTIRINGDAVTPMLALEYVSWFYSGEIPLNYGGIRIDGELMLFVIDHSSEYKHPADTFIFWRQPNDSLAESSL